MEGDSDWSLVRIRNGACVSQHMPVDIVDQCGRHHCRPWFRGDHAICENPLIYKEQKSLATRTIAPTVMMGILDVMGIPNRFDSVDLCLVDLIEMVGELHQLCNRNVGYM